MSARCPRPGCGRALPDDNFHRRYCSRRCGRAEDKRRARAGHPERGLAQKRRQRERLYAAGLTCRGTPRAAAVFPPDARPRQN